MMRTDRWASVLGRYARHNNARKREIVALVSFMHDIYPGNIFFSFQKQVIYGSSKTITFNL